MVDRAILFVDGNNWFHSLRACGVADLIDLDYAKISLKLIAPREWLATRYYIGQVQNTGNERLYADQRRFLARLRATDARISTHLGRIESRPTRNEAAIELRQYLANLKAQIPSPVFRDLMELACRHATSEVSVEKAVDVMLAVDMVVMAERNEYDAAYVLSADGDFTPAAEAVRSMGKKVYAASVSTGAQLARAVNSFIHIDRQWFGDCY